MLDPLQTAIEVRDHMDLAMGQEAHLREQRVDLRPQAAQHQADAVVRAELVEFAEGQGHRSIEPLDHPEIEEQVPHALAEDQLATRLHQVRGEGEEQVTLQAQGPGGGPRPLQLGHLLEGALLVGTMGAAGQVVTDVVGTAVAVDEEDRGHQEAGITPVMMSLTAMRTRMPTISAYSCRGA